MVPSGSGLYGASANLSLRRLYFLSMNFRYSLIICIYLPIDIDKKKNIYIYIYIYTVSSQNSSPVLGTRNIRDHHLQWRTDHRIPAPLNAQKSTCPYCVWSALSSAPHGFPKPLLELTERLRRTLEHPHFPHPESQYLPNLLLRCLVHAA